MLSRCHAFRMLCTEIASFPGADKDTSLMFLGGSTSSVSGVAG